MNAVRNQFEKTVAVAVQKILPCWIGIDQLQFAGHGYLAVAFVVRVKLRALLRGFGFGGVRNYVHGKQNNLGICFGDLQAVNHRFEVLSRGLFGYSVWTVGVIDGKLDKHCVCLQCAGLINPV